MKHVYFLRDLCMSCHQCETACSVAHPVSRPIYNAVAETVKPLSRIAVKVGSDDSLLFPQKCRHCDPAPCIESCHSGALSRDSSTGLVILDENACVGCRRCTKSCPFGAITSRNNSGYGIGQYVAVKCDGCIALVTKGGTPACVESCKSGALVYSDDSVPVSVNKSR